LESGVASFLGTSLDHGYNGMYYVQVQALIALDTYLLKGSKTDLFVNRIIAQMTGIAMAMVIASIPPFVRGGDPQHVSDYFASLNDAFHDLTTNIIDGRLKDMTDRNSENNGDPINNKKPKKLKKHKKKMKPYVKTFLEDAEKQKQFTQFVLKDASMLQIMPFLKVDKRVGRTLDSLKVTQSMIEQFAAFSSELCRAEDKADEWDCVVSFIKGRMSSSASQTKPWVVAIDDETAANEDMEVKKFQDFYVVIQQRLWEASSSVGTLVGRENAAGI